MTYRMSKEAYQGILKALSTDKKKAQRSDVIAYINSEFGIKGTIADLFLV